jgi:flagellar motor switch protein FliG
MQPGPRRAAVLMTAIDAASVERLIAALAPDAVKRIRRQIALLETLPTWPEEIRDALEEARRAYDGGSPPAEAPCFGDLLRARDGGLAELFHRVELSRLALALRTAPPELREKFAGAVGPQNAELIREEIEFIGPVRVADVEGAQEEIVQLAGRLRAEGLLQLGDPAGRDAVERRVAELKARLAERIAADPEPAASAVMGWMDRG